jgi:DNA-binding response OmpR family regulator
MGGDGSVPAFRVEAFARQAGADRVLHKPFGAHELNATVSELRAVASGG